ncbi:lipoprotein signal peptidase [Clostridium sp. CAG:762]|nr:lipoprotein signal peptidase [Clostridium sp. CAG:762]
MKKVYIIALISLIIDQIVKILVSNYLILGQTTKIINNFFYLTYVQNTGAAFSILIGYRYILIIITLIFLYYLYKYTKKQTNPNKLAILSHGLLLGGIIGNLIDRIIYGYVIDYLDFMIFNYNFPIFNLADTFIVIGCIILVINSYAKGENS